MKIAILSDVHANYHALTSVLDDVRLESPNLIVFLGDFFGYYPWAVETYRLVKQLDAVAVKGNHDLLLSPGHRPARVSWHHALAKENRCRLQQAAPDAIGWLQRLPLSRTLTCDGLSVQLCHGTPADPADGRYYPDDGTDYPWFPGKGEVLLLGHTHYPLRRWTKAGGLVINPGSVGQPRDGDCRASWGLFDTKTLRFEVRRTPYDVRHSVELLKAMGADYRLTQALQKDRQGSSTAQPKELPNDATMVQDVAPVEPLTRSTDESSSLTN